MALSHRHVARPLRSDSPESRKPRCTRVNREPSSSYSSSPRKWRASRRSARESLRSTMLTNGSDSMDEDATQAEDPQTQELQVFVQLQRPLSDWVYWQRDAELLPDCWTRVFAVFCGNLLWLYRYEDASAKSLLLRVRVTALQAAADNRRLQFTDTATSASIQLCLPDAASFYRWHSHVATAVGKFPQEETANAPQVAAMQKKTFWNALAKALVHGANNANHHQAENQIVVCEKTSLGQKWKTVTQTLKGALKLRRRRAQLQL